MRPPAGLHGSPGDAKHRPETARSRLLTMRVERRSRMSVFRARNSRRKQGLSSYKPHNGLDVLTAIFGSALFWTRRFLHGPSAFLTFVFAEIGLMRLSTIIIAAAALAGSFATANAVPAVQAGLLECRGGQNVGFVVGSVANLECVFQSRGRRAEAYVAAVRRIGI